MMSLQYASSKYRPFEKHMDGSFHLLLISFSSKPGLLRLWGIRRKERMHALFGDYDGISRAFSALFSFLLLVSFLKTKKGER